MAASTFDFDFDYFLELSAKMEQVFHSHLIPHDREGKNPQEGRVILTKLVELLAW